MNNISAINHLRFDRLHDLTKNYNKATLLDKLIYWWQISKFTLNDEKIWFTRSIDAIAADSKIARRSVERYLCEFEQSGLIEKTNILYKKKNLYIRLTEKLLAILGTQPLNTVSTESDKVGEGDQPLVNESLFLKQDGGTDNANMAQSIYKDKDYNLVNNNTVSQLGAVNNFETKPNKNIQSLYPTYAIEEIIGERITIREKNYIKGMMHNLQKNQGVTVSSPEQLFAEIVFTIVNVEQLQGINNFNHRVQIIAKLLRQKKWLTPKGFYNHSDFGAPFRKQVAKTDNDCIYPQPTPKPGRVGGTISLEQQKLQLENQLNESCRLMPGEINQFKEAVGRFKSESGSILLVNSIASTLIGQCTQQSILYESINSLESKLYTKPSWHQDHSIKTLMNNLTVLKHQEHQLRDLMTQAFEVFCDATKLKSCVKEIDRAYEHYEEFHKLLGDVERKRKDIEEQLDYQYSA